jgi:exodeoxyribonuclease VII large subunit
LRDILATLHRRWRVARVVIYPAAVQGDGAAAEIARAIRTANERAEVDVLIVARGGGSIEDLWAFNEEIVADAAINRMNRPPAARGAHEYAIVLHHENVLSHKSPRQSAATPKP